MCTKLLKHNKFLSTNFLHLNHSLKASKSRPAGGEWVRCCQSLAHTHTHTRTYIHAHRSLRPPTDRPYGKVPVYLSSQSTSRCISLKQTFGMWFTYVYNTTENNDFATLYASLTRDHYYLHIIIIIMCGYWCWTDHWEITGVWIL